MAKGQAYTAAYRARRQAENAEAKLDNFMREVNALADTLPAGNFVRINEMRDKLGWKRNEFDNMLINLRNSGKIQLMEADITLMSDKEIDKMFVDENGFRMGTILITDRPSIRNTIIRGDTAVSTTTPSRLSKRSAFVRWLRGE